MPARRNLGALGFAAPNAVTAETSPYPRVFTKQVTELDAPTRAEIRERAYFIYLARNGDQGDPLADWFQAERELFTELARRDSGRSF